MKQIICLAGQPWSSSPGRTQQLLSRLRDTQVLYFSPAAGQLDRSYLKKGKKVRPNITVYTLPPTWVPVEETYGRLFRPGQRKIGRFIRSVATRHRFREPLLWATDPRQVHLLDLLDYGGLVYDCDREWEGLPLDWEGCLAGAADVVFAASPLLVDRLAPCSSNVALLPNGVNFPLFSRPSDLSYDPLPQTAGPVLGWAGTIRPELDLEPLLYAARTMPRWTFVLLGPQGEGNSLLPRLRRLPNVVLPGGCPMAQVPDWLYRCDVLLDFLRDDRTCDDLVSCRMLEYLATGRPVVSMLWPDQIEPLPDVVYGAHSDQEFLTLCRHALDEPPNFAAQRRRSHAAAASWSLRCTQVVNILTTAGLL